jgi:paraquat-inducible protein A
VLPELEEDQKAHCPRCNYLLTSRHSDTINRILAFSASGIIFLILTFLFPFITFNAQGVERVINFQQSIDILFYKDYASLAILIYFLTIVFPCTILAGSFYVSLAIKRHQLLPATRTVMRLLVLLQPWSMVEIFLIGILVSFIKIISLADVSLGLSFSAYVLFSLCLTIVLLHLDKYQFWLKINTINTKNR